MEVGAAEVELPYELTMVRFSPNSPRMRNESSIATNHWG
jgi:hypothetical protein